MTWQPELDELAHHIGAGHDRYHKTIVYTVRVSSLNWNMQKNQKTIPEKFLDRDILHYECYHD